MIVNVRNRNNGTTGYILDDSRVNRQFAPGETKKIDSDELQQLFFQRGGEYLLRHFLIIQDEKIRDQILGSVEPEYNYTEADIEKLLLNGSEDELRDCLDFAPDGVKELLKEIAVKLRLNDVRKRDIISKATGIDLNSAITFRTEIEDDENQNAATEVKERRVELTAQSVAPARRVIITGGSSNGTES